MSIPKQSQPYSTGGGPHTIPNPAPAPVSNPYQHTVPSTMTSYVPYAPTGQTGQTTSNQHPLDRVVGMGGAPTIGEGGAHINQSGQPISIFNPAVVTTVAHGVTSAPLTSAPGGGMPPTSQFSLPPWNDPPTITAKKKVDMHVLYSGITAQVRHE